MRTVLKLGVIAFAVIGMFATVYWARWSVALPHVVAGPDQFLVMEIYGSAKDSPIAEIYFDAPSSMVDLQFEGSELMHQITSSQGLQKAPGPLQKVTVSGKGQVHFGSANIEVDGNKVAINGHQLCPSEVTVTRRGSYREGYIRTAR